MSGGGAGAVVLDTMAVSALVNASRNPGLATSYRGVIAAAPIVVSFVTVTELRFGALRAGWGELRRRGLERDLAQFVIARPDDALMRICAELRLTAERAGLGLGNKIHEADRWVAATALRLDLDLVSTDAVFRGVPGLTLRAPATA